jgi:hypothetical protein
MSLRRRLGIIGHIIMAITTRTIVVTPAAAIITIEVTTTDPMDMIIIAVVTVTVTDGGKSLRDRPWAPASC